MLLACDCSRACIHPFHRWSTHNTVEGLVLICLALCAQLMQLSVTISWFKKEKFVQGAQDHGKCTHEPRLHVELLFLWADRLWGVEIDDDLAWETSSTMLLMIYELTFHNFLRMPLWNHLTKMIYWRMDEMKLPKRLSSMDYGHKVILLSFLIFTL